MRRTLAAAAVLSCLCAFLGCRHVAGVCDCAPDASLNYWGCGAATPTAPGAMAPQAVISTPAAPAAQPEAIKVMPKPDAPK